MFELKKLDLLLEACVKGEAAVLTENDYFADTYELSLVTEVGGTTSLRVCPGQKDWSIGLDTHISNERKNATINLHIPLFSR